jgi:hypothetical protein
MSEKFVSKAVDEMGDGLDVYRDVQVGTGGGGGSAGRVTDVPAIFRQDNLESVGVGGESMFAIIQLKSYTSFQTTIMKHFFCLGDF